MLNKLIMKFLSPERIVKIVLQLIVKFIKNGQKDSNKWDIGMKIVQIIKNACTLFEEVYNDDSMSTETEDKIANSILDMVNKK